MPNNGAWGPVNSWPIIAINATLTPDGKVLSHGTDVQGQQGGMMYFDVWDPVTGQHQIMQHATHTDLFCSATVIVPETGEVLIAGGDTRGLGGGLINFGVPDTNVYNWWDESLVQSNTGPMHHGRWYPTVVALSNDKIFVTGGVNGDNQGVGMPELYTPGSGWKELPGADTNNTVLDWWYPRAWVSSNGLIYSFVTNTVNPGGKVMAIDPSGDGTLAEVGVTPFTNNYQLPAVMFEKDKILVIEGNGNAWIMDISGPVPTYQQTAAVGVHRFWSNLVVLADGSVMVSGGSAIENQLVGVNNQVRIWHPNTGQWTDGPEAAVPRLYHSTTLLLPDGRVLSAGGGAPGPLTNLNSEIYTPDYLFNDDGTLAARPAILDGPTKVAQHAHFDITVDDGAQISRVTLVKFGNATHAFNMDQRKIDLPFEVHGNEIGIQLPDNPNVTTPGYWMLFVFNEAGAPSIARTIHIGVGGEFYSDQMKSFVTFNGYANYDAAENAFMITPDVPDLIGTVGTNQRVDLTKSFQIGFQVNLGNKDLSADGISFVIHNSPWGADAVGFKGDGVGAVGIGNGIAIKLDSFQSGAPYNDVPGDHTNFVNTSAPPGAQDITGQVALGNINDGQWHNVEVTWDAATQTLFYYVDGKVASAIQQNISQAYLGGSNLAYLAFTGASGPGGNQQMVRVTNFNGVYEVKPDIVEPAQQIQNVSSPDNLGDIFEANPVDDIVGFLGSTVYVPQNQAVMLTGPVEGETGGMAFQQRVDFTHDFALQAQFNFSDKPIAGDGAAIVFHNDPRGLIALGNGGADFGAAGVQNGIGIALDTYKNDAPYTDQYADNTNFIDTSLDPAQRDLLGHQNPGNLNDGRWHVVQVFWDVQTQNLTYLVDGKVMGTLHRNLIADSFGGSNYAYLAITGATGGAATLQQMRINSLQAVFEPKPFGGQDPNDPNCVFDMRTLKDNVTFNGDALYDVGADSIFLTTNDAGRTAGITFDKRVDLKHDFNIIFEVNGGASPNGGDGMALVLHNDPSGAGALGYAGGNLGAYGLANGIGISFDSWQNEAPYNDAFANSSAIFKTGEGLAGSKLAPQFDLGNFKDGAWHKVGLTWDAETQTLRYWVDGHPAGELKQDLAQSFLGGSNFAYLGFTAATGAASNLQQLKVHAVDAIFEGDLDIHNCKFDLSNLSEKVSVVGSAAYDLASQTFVITADAVGQAGAVTFNERIDLAHDFIVSFDVYLAAKPAGGDGMAFVLHNDPRGAAALGFAGGNLGAVGLANGMAVTFDTYQNGAPFFDMPNDHSSILHTDPMIDGHHGQLGVQIGNQANLGNIKDGLWHNVVITWEAETQTLKYWFDGKQANQYAGDLAHTFLGGSEYAYIGFTGATGASTNEQLVKINSVSALLEGQDHGHEPGHTPVTITDHDHNA